MRFRYIGDPVRLYPTFGLMPTVGDVYELDADPGDGRWTPADDQAEHAEPAEHAGTPPAVESEEN